MSPSTLGRTTLKSNLENQKCRLRDSLFEEDTVNSIAGTQDLEVFINPCAIGRGSGNVAAGKVVDTVWTDDDTASPVTENPDAVRFSGCLHLSKFKKKTSLDDLDSGERADLPDRDRCSIM
eukprot:CAMPEP_0117692928 /NCGR_PEP_ID=MMETSP0804-20121206/26589_1 /TAXON_ID=1074897 /ORGANISM="Tetraselmis astigmatica, Strain CCMP880" /LENGTH=120 /DNA_ID=CAMNT_0005506409 /DNA_START=371 /DNA_END=733 /DNA_ORIENTATION=+